MPTDTCTYKLASGGVNVAHEALSYAIRQLKEDVQLVSKHYGTDFYKLRSVNSADA